MLVFMRMTTLFGVLFWMDNTKFLMWPPLDSLEAIDQLVPFVFQAFQTLSISITLLWQKLNFLWCIFMYPKCCSVLPGSIAFPVVWWCKNTLTEKKKKRETYFIWMYALKGKHNLKFLQEITRTHRGQTISVFRCHAGLSVLLAS